MRRALKPDRRPFTLTDTVGFVRHLPHQLVEAFRSTLEEVGQADAHLHVVDGSHPDPEGQLAAVRGVLSELGGRDVPEIVVVNKADVADPDVVARLLRREPAAVAVSAVSGRGLDRLRERIGDVLPRPDLELEVLVPFSRGDLVHRVHSTGEVLHEEHTPDGTLLRVLVDPVLAAELEGYSGTRQPPAPSNAGRS